MARLRQRKVFSLSPDSAEQGPVRISEIYRPINLAFRNAGGAPRSISWRRMIDVVLRND